MCNPRRVMIQLSRAIEEAWRTTVEQTARAQAEVEQTARITVDIPLGDEMGDLALEMLERLLRGEFPDYAAWQRDELGQYRRDLGEVTLLYQPGSRQLLVEARLAESISAEVRAAAEVSGFTVGEVAVEAVAGYYEDGWGGRTEERAQAEAQADGARKLAEAVEALHRSRHADELAEAESQAREQAERLAAAELAQRQADMRNALRTRLQGIMANAQERVRHTVNQLAGESCRHALIHLVQENGGRVLSDERSGSVINLELELN